MITLAFRQKNDLSAPLGLQGQVQMTDFFSGLFGVQIAIAAITILAGILLYIWSFPLGRLVARGVEE
jgi:hypothetical protein